ncbi:hypothetical protein QPK87_15825 [Kamptonema cortianum]|nr:hypothetical protein [Kamptonema cortianum]
MPSSKKRADNPAFQFKDFRPPKFDDEAQLRKDFPPKAPAPTLWQKIESRLISIPGTNTISATKFPTSSIPPVAAPQEKTASASAPAAAQPPKIPTVTTATQSSRDISTVAQPVKLNPLTSAPPPVKVPPKAEPTGQIAAKSGEKADPTPATTTTDKPIQTAPPVVKLPPGLPPQSSVTAPPCANCSGIGQKARSSARCSESSCSRSPDGRERFRPSQRHVCGQNRARGHQSACRQG